MKITHDFHIHTKLSSCAPDDSGSLQAYLAHAKRLGLKKLGFSDHYWDEKIPADFLSLNDNVTANTIPGAPATYDFYTVQNTPHIWQLKNEIDQLTDEEKGDIQIYFGCEAEYDPFHRDLAVTDETAEKFDFIVVATSHTHMMMNRDLYFPWENHRDFIMQAYNDILDSPRSRFVTSMAHPFSLCCAPYDGNYLLDRMTEYDFSKLFDKTASKGIAVEINVGSLLKASDEQILASPRVRMIQIAKKYGCKFLFGSDSHTGRTHENYHNCDRIADLIGLTEDDIAPIGR